MSAIPPDPLFSYDFRYTYIFARLSSGFVLYRSIVYSVNLSTSTPNVSSVAASVVAAYCDKGVPPGKEKRRSKESEEIRKGFE